MLIYNLQESISKVVTEIMKKQNFKRGIRRSLEVDLLISNIKENSFSFEANNDFDEKVVRTYTLHGVYSAGEPAFKFQTVIEKGGSAAIVTYDVYMYANGNVICKPDAYENSIYKVNPEKLEFTI